MRKGPRMVERRSENDDTPPPEFIAEMEMLRQIYVNKAFDIQSAVSILNKDLYESYAYYLYGDGLVMFTDDGKVYITPEGVERLRVLKLLKGDGKSGSEDKS